MPDFSIDLHFECGSSYIPFISSLAPSDTYKIYKRGSDLRLDMTLIGFKKFSAVRGNITVLYKGKKRNNISDDDFDEGELLLID